VDNAPKSALRLLPPPVLENNLESLSHSLLAQQTLFRILSLPNRRKRVWSRVIRAMFSSQVNLLTLNKMIGQEINIWKATKGGAWCPEDSPSFGSVQYYVGSWLSGWDYGTHEMSTSLRPSPEAKAFNDTVSTHTNLIPKRGEVESTLTWSVLLAVLNSFSSEQTLTDASFCKGVDPATRSSGYGEHKIWNARHCHCSSAWWISGWSLESPRYRVVVLAKYGLCLRWGVVNLQNTLLVLVKLVNVWFLAQEYQGIGCDCTYISCVLSWNQLMAHTRFTIDTSVMLELTFHMSWDLMPALKLKYHREL